mmetsp:Transcript_8122/g.25325  ORF Transcript_8122/g.25325 Transcript_8122/m.25325 type:complete len:236 (-) Transcript_8122:200-907(-)
MSCVTARAARRPIGALSSGSVSSCTKARKPISPSNVSHRRRASAAASCGTMPVFCRMKLHSCSNVRRASGFGGLANVVLCAAYQRGKSSSNDTRLAKASSRSQNVNASPPDDARCLKSAMSLSETALGKLRALQSLPSSLLDMSPDASLSTRSHPTTSIARRRSTSTLSALAAYAAHAAFPASPCAVAAASTICDADANATSDCSATPAIADAKKPGVALPAATTLATRALVARA